jgi:hypothetical protein
VRARGETRETIANVGIVLLAGDDEVPAIAGATRCAYRSPIPRYQF